MKTAQESKVKDMEKELVRLRAENIQLSTDLMYSEARNNVLLRQNKELISAVAGARSQGLIE